MLSHDDKFQSLYRIVVESSGQFVILGNEWKEYLEDNYTIVLGWWENSYVKYLQKHNPTVLSIATKLVPPQGRNMGDVKKLFREYFLGKIPLCVYTDNPIGESISHDHFYPWSFMGCDPLYNFVPTTKKTNSAKSNLIPNNIYLEKVSNFQFDFFSFLKEKHSSKIESFLNDLHIDRDSSRNQFSLAYKNYYKPLYISARNQGFKEWR